MKAVGVLRHLPTDQPERFIDMDALAPSPRLRDVLVRVKAVSVNPVDTGQRPLAPNEQPAPQILGWDAAGIVEAVGDKVTLFKPGDAVWYAGDITRQGCDAELHCVDERIAGFMPKTLSFAEAAAMPLTTLTAWEGIFERMKAHHAPDNSLLIIAGAGGVGSIAIQLARHAGLRVIATASRPESIDWCKKMGADDVINHQLPLREELTRIGVNEVDAILCCRHTDRYIRAMAEVIRPQGAVCSIISAPHGNPLDVSPFFSKSVSFHWELMYTRSQFQTPDMVEQHHILNRAAALIDAGKLRSTLTDVVGPLNAANLFITHRRIESQQTIGKLVLTL
jgi:NADPH2:quinone reductase